MKNESKKKGFFLLIKIFFLKINLNYKNFEKKIFFFKFKEKKLSEISK